MDFNSHAWVQLIETTHPINAQRNALQQLCLTSLLIGMGDELGQAQSFPNRHMHPRSIGGIHVNIQDNDANSSIQPVHQTFEYK